MNRDDIQKLLGGYATGTLTPEEQEALFEAALDDQELFDALAREQALRDLLRDPASKAELLAALDHRPPRWYERLVPSWRPLAAVAAMAGVSALAVVVWQGAKAPKPVLMARATLPPAAVSEPPSAMAADKDSEPPAANRQPAANERTFQAPAPERRQTAAPAAKPQPSAEEDRRDKAKLEAPAKAAPPADSTAALKKEDAPVAATPPLPRPSIASGFREGALPAGAGGGVSPAQPAEPTTARGRMAGGTVGGVMGGVIGGVPANAPAAPPPPKALAVAPPAQAATETKQTPGGPAQQTPGQQAPSPFAQQQPVLSQAEQVRVQAEKLTLDAVASADAQTLFYGLDPKTGARGGGAGGAASRKKSAAAVPIPAQGVANSVAVTTGVVQSMLARGSGVRYSLLRKNAAGVFETADPDSLRAGDTVELQVQPNTSGFIRVRARRESGSWREVTSQGVTAFQDYITKALRPGENEVEIRLIPTTVGYGVSALRDEKSAAPSRKSTPDATYVVAPSGSSQLLFTIPLNYK